MRKTTIRRALFVGAGAAVVLALLPATPALADPPCGATVVADVTVTADLTCAGNWLVIGADNLTIDLAGHTIQGNGTGMGINDNGHPGLVVKGGTMAGFATGIRLFGFNVATVTGMTIRDGRALHASIVNDITVTSSEFRNTNLRLESNSKRASFTQVLFRNTSVALSEANDSKWRQDDLLDSSIDSFESDNGNVTETAFIRSSLTYRVTSRNWQISNNVFRGAPIGLTVGSNSPGGVISNNMFAGHNLGILISVTNLGEIPGTSVAENTFVNNGAAGLLFNSAAITGTPAVRIVQNRFIHNGFNPAGRTDRLGRPVSDGLHTATTPGSQIFIGSNVTVNNASRGISADPGTVVDAGGNKSIGDPLGCSGVVCV